MSTKTQKCAVVETMEQRMKASMYVALRTIVCKFHDGVLTLQGIVPSFYVKSVLLSLAEDFLEREDVTQINDAIDVVNSQGLSSVKTAS